MRIALLNPRYPYGKDQVFLGGSLPSIGARLLQMGHEVDLFDLNIDRITDARVAESLAQAERIGISLTGSPYIPGTLSLIDQLRTHGVSAPILLGGQVIARLQSSQFVRIIGRQCVVQIRDDNDLVQALGCHAVDMPSANTTSFIPIWEKMGEERMAEYLRHEGTLVVSQGCKKACRFCAASKGRAEVFRDIGAFESDLRYLTDVARRNGLR